MLGLFFLSNCYVQTDQWERDLHVWGKNEGKKMWHPYHLNWPQGLGIQTSQLVTGLGPLNSTAAKKIRLLSFESELVIAWSTFQSDSSRKNKGFLLSLVVYSSLLETCNHFFGTQIHTVCLDCDSSYMEHTFKSLGKPVISEQQIFHTLKSCREKQGFTGIVRLQPN